MKTNIYRVFGVAVLCACMFLPCGVKDASAGVSVNINIGPPPIVLPSPPEMVMVPGSPVFFVPNLDLDVFFYGGYWWSPRGDRWYRSRTYNGPWQTINRRYIPRPVIRVPRDYRRVYEGEPRIPYGQWKKERRQRENEERHEWNRGHGEWSPGPGRGHGRDN